MRTHDREESPLGARLHELLLVISALAFAVGIAACDDTGPVLPEAPPAATGEQLQLEPTEPGDQPLRAERTVQLRVSDFPGADAPRIIAVDISVKGPKKDRDRDAREVILDTLKNRVSAPYQIRDRKDLEHGERAWARAQVTFRRRLDRYARQGKKTPRRGKLRWGIEIAMSVPKGMSANWNGFAHNVVYERPYEQLLRLDDELWSGFEDRLPALVVTADETASEFPRELELREELLDGVLHPVFDEPVRGVFRGGCVAVEGPDGVTLRRLRAPSAPGIPAPDGERITARCTDAGAYIAHARTDRSVEITYEPWDSGEGWSVRTSFARAIDVDAMRFLAAGDALCLVGERRDAGSRHANVHCFDPATGAKRWERTEPGTDFEAIVIRGGLVAFAAGRHVRILDVRTGEELWGKEVDDATGLAAQPGGCLIGDTFVFPHGLGQYMALDLASREAPWELTSFGGNFFYCDGAGGLYFDEAGGLLLALEADTLAPRWRFRVAERVVDALFHGGYLFVLMPRAIFALDAQSGEIAWQLGLPVEGSRLLRHNRRLYLVGDDAIYDLSRADRR